LTVADMFERCANPSSVRAISGLPPSQVHAISARGNGKGMSRGMTR
jgi:hypothetical protein